VDPIETLRPRSPGILTVAITDVRGNHWARLGVQSGPEPLPACLLRRPAARFVSFDILRNVCNFAQTAKARSARY
jgi:predicted lipoprotein